MDKDKEKFPRQDAPIKNTDDAFVRVSEDGSPSFPQEVKSREELASEHEQPADEKDEH